MHTTLSRQFTDEHLGDALDAMHDAELDELGFGVIGFDAQGVVHAYNRYEAQAAGLARDRVIGRELFTSVAPCMNNYLVAQRFADAKANGAPLDVTIDYVLTLRMRPTPVRLRLVAAPWQRHAYVLVERVVGPLSRAWIRRADGRDVTIEPSAYEGAQCSSSTVRRSGWRR